MMIIQHSVIIHNYRMIKKVVLHTLRWHRIRPQKNVYFLYHAQKIMGRSVGIFFFSKFLSLYQMSLLQVLQNMAKWLVLECESFTLRKTSAAHSA
jgi:hypothetical protein